MPQVVRIAHPDILSPEGVPTGPYNAHNYTEHYDDCMDSYSYSPNPDCLACKANSAVEATYTLDWLSTPPPGAEGIKFIAGEHLSGFITFDQLFDWFGDVLDIFREAGFIIYIYESDDVQAARHQAAIPAQRSTLVDTMPL